MEEKYKVEFEKNNLQIKDENSDKNKEDSSKVTGNKEKTIKNQENAKPVSVSSADTNIFGATAVATQAEDPFNIDINEI
jgi:hypothetical protein